MCQCSPSYLSSSASGGGTLDWGNKEEIYNGYIAPKNGIILWVLATLSGTEIYINGNCITSLYSPSQSLGYAECDSGSINVSKGNLITFSGIQRNKSKVYFIPFKR